MILQFIIDAKDRTKAAFDKVRGNVNEVQGKLERLQPAFDKIAKGALLAGGAMVVGIGVKSVKAAADFEKAMASVATLVDTSTENMEEMGKKVREISKRVPKDISELTVALYDVRSAGISAADAMDVLEASAKLAVAGLGTTQEATNLLTSAINVYGDTTHDANALAEILFKTVKYGKTTIAELSQGFGKVAAIAKETGISIEDLSAATALLTTGGIKAAEAQTALKAMISNVLKPTKDATDAAEKLGIQFDLGALQAKGLSGMLAEIAEKAGTDKQALADLFGSVEAANAIFALTSVEGGAAFRQILEDMTAQTGALDEATRLQNAAASAQYQLLKNQLNVVFIELGTQILPLLLKAMEEIRDMIDTATWVWKIWGGEIVSVNDALADLEYKLMIVIETAKGFFSTMEKISSFSRQAIGAVTGWSALKWTAGKLGFQKGGIVPGPIGEPMSAIVHGGETIIPAGKFGGGITINIMGGNYLSRDAATMFGKEIANELKRDLKL